MSLLPEAKQVGLGNVQNRLFTSFEHSLFLENASGDPPKQAPAMFRCSQAFNTWLGYSGLANKAKPTFKFLNGHLTNVLDADLLNFIAMATQPTDMQQRDSVKYMYQSADFKSSYLFRFL